MMPTDPQAISLYLQFLGAASAVAGVLDWLRRDSPAEDATLLEASKVLVTTVLDSDTVARIEMATGRNIRDQITPQELAELQKHVELLQMGKGRN